MRSTIKKILKPFLYYLPQLPNSIRYGKVYRDTYKFLQESQYWSKEQIEEWQLKKLQELVLHAYETVPYYNKLFKKHNILPSDIKCLEDIKKIPYLTKEIIRNNLENLVSSKYKKKLHYVTTGGSTGTPMGFYYQQKYTESREQAFLWYLWDLKNIKLTDKFAIIRGSILPPNKIMHYNRSNRLVLSSYALNNSNIPLMLNELEKFKPNVIQAYPSSLYLIAQWIKTHNYKMIFSLKTILTSSELLYPHQEKLFKDVFKTDVYDLYGNSEKTVMINRCEKSSFHIIPGYGFTELINQFGEWGYKENEKCEIVSTSFNNYAMPFIRYKTNDIAINSQKVCSCKRKWNLIQALEGRLHDYVIGSERNKITLTALIFSQHFDAFGKCKNMQLCQNEIGKVIVNIVENKKLNEMDKSEIIDKIKLASNNTIIASITIVDEIKRTKAGKYRFLLQELPLEFGE